MYLRKEHTEYDRVYNQGLHDERKVIDFIYDQGFKIEQTEVLEDQLADIDAFIDGESISVKAEHTGLRYGHIYVEMATQRYQSAFWTPEQKAEMNCLLQQFPYQQKNKYQWNPGWWYYGNVKYYLILQGLTLRLYLKTDIDDYMVDGGIVRMCGLSPSVLKQQGNRDTLCCYMDRTKVPWQQEWKLSA